MDGKLDATGGPLKKGQKIGGPGRKLTLGQAWDKSNREFMNAHAYVSHMNDVNMWSELFPETRVRQLYLICGMTDGNAVAWSALLGAAPDHLSPSSGSSCPVTRG